MKYPILAGLLTFLVSPAHAAEYYVIKIQPSGTCLIVDHKPNQTSDTIIGTSPYATKDEAKKAKKAATECTTADKPKS